MFDEKTDSRYLCTPDPASSNYYVSTFINSYAADMDKDRIGDIRQIDNTHIEVDTCEVWTNNTYNRSSGELVQSEGPTLIPQTITIQQLNSNWYITDVQFYDTPAFYS